MTTGRAVSILRTAAVGAALTLGGVACATTGTVAFGLAEEAFVPDVSEQEWQAALPAKGSAIEEPELKQGKKALDPEAGLLRLGETAVTTVEMVIRADGTVGLYRLRASTNPRVTARILRLLRSQRYESPILNGAAVAIRGPVTLKMTRTK